MSGNNHVNARALLYNDRSEHAEVADYGHEARLHQHRIALLAPRRFTRVSDLKPHQGYSGTDVP
jgi:hypothetical protein